MTQQPASPGERFLFVDFLRGWAVLVMIETHLVNALLLGSLKDEAPFKVLTFVNGLVAPSFLFCAGFALAIALRRKWQQYCSLERPLWRYILRLGFILIVGYSLHVPHFRLSQMMTLTDEGAWISFFQSDILHVIALTLFALTVLAVVARKERLFYALSGLLTLLMIFISPIVRQIDYSGFPIWFRGYLTTQYKSQFPLFPWSAFLMAGTIIGYWFIRMRELQRESKMMPRLALFAFLGLALSLLIEIAPISVYPNHNFWFASPEFFFVRLGLVVLFCVGLWSYERRQSGSSPHRSPITIFGQESLLVYVVHLLMIYGHTFEFSFIRVYGPTLNYLECGGLLAGLTLAMYLLAYAWHRLKAWNKRAAAVIQFAVLTGIVLQFTLR